MNLLENSTQDVRLEAGPHCILMLHGLGAGPLELIRLAQEAHREQFSVWVPSIEGYCFGGELQAWEHWQSQVLAHYWAAREHFETVSVVGVSMGATLSMLLAQHEEPTACVFLASALGYDGWAMPWYRFLLKYARWIPFSDGYKYHEQEPYGVKNEQTRAMVKRMLSLNRLSEVGAPTLSLGQLKQGHGLIEHVLENLQAVHAPSLFIHAVDDESVHIRNAEMAYDSISSRDKQFIYLGNSYHMVTADNERETVHAQTLRFIKTKVNQSLSTPFFEMPNIISSELRRHMARTRGASV
jgi:carboxylesterase